MAEIYHSQNKPRRALATLQLLVEQYGTEPPPTRALLLQGLALKSLERYDEAIQTLNLVCQRDTADAEALYQLAECHWKTGDLANAGLAVQAAPANNPAHEASRRLQVDIQANQRHLTAGLKPAKNRIVAEIPRMRPLASSNSHAGRNARSQALGSYGAFGADDAIRRNAARTRVPRLRLGTRWIAGSAGRT